MFEKWMEKYKDKQKKLSEQRMCNEYKEIGGASNGGCMGFADGWQDTHAMCLKCNVFYENI